MNKFASKIWFSLAVLTILMLSTATILGVVNYYSMTRMVKTETATLIAEASKNKSRIFSYRDIEGLPLPVQRYFRYALKEGQEYLTFIQVKASGDFKRPLDQTASKFTVDQTISADPPGLVFSATMKPNSFTWFLIRDKYYHAQGGMHVNLFSGFNVLNQVGGNELNTTTLIRWAGEAVMMPTALLPSQYLHWEPIDETSARAIITDGDLRGSVRFFFNDIGEIVRCESDDRYDMIDGRFQKVGSIAYRSHYQEYNGIKIPMKFNILRVLPDGKQEEFWKGEVMDIRFH